MAESGQPFDKIASQLVVIELVKVIHPQVLKMTSALKQVIVDPDVTSAFELGSGNGFARSSASRTSWVLVGC